MEEGNLNINKYEIVEKTFTLKTANIIGTLLLVPICAIFFGIYFSIAPEQIYNYNSMYIIILFVLGILFHEFIHGFVWHLYCQGKWKNIKFGFDWKTFSPYTNCTQLLTIKNYRLGAISPFLLTGVLPYIIGILLNNSTIVYASILLICGSIGDLMILFIISKEKHYALVKDHPTLCGCTVYREKENK